MRRVPCWQQAFRRHREAAYLPIRANHDLARKMAEPANRIDKPRMSEFGSSPFSQASQPPPHARVCCKTRFVFSIKAVAMPTGC